VAEGIPVTGLWHSGHNVHSVLYEDTV